MGDFWHKLHNFFSDGIWRIDPSVKKNRFERIVIRELQYVTLEMKLFYRNSSFSRAASLAYTTLLSLVPTLAITFMLFKMFGGKGIVEQKIKPLIYTFLTTGSGDKISSYLDSFLNSTTVETIGAIGILFLLFGVYSILNSIEESFTQIWNIRNPRSPLDQIKYYIVLLVSLPVLVTVSFSVSSVLEIGNWGLVQSVLSRVIPFLITAGFFMLLIVSMPNRKVKLRFALYGSAVAAVLYYVSRYLFVYYTNLAVSTNVIYGSLAVLPFFMVWLFSFWCIVLFSVHIVYVRHYWQALKHIELRPEIGRNEDLRVGLLVAIELLTLFLRDEEPVSRFDIEVNLAIPPREIRSVLRRMEQGGLIRMMTGDLKLLPAVPLESFTVGRTMDAVDRNYLHVIEYDIEKKRPAVADIEEALRKAPEEIRTRSLKDFI